MVLDARKKAIIEAVVKEFSVTFEPVGSKLLSSRYFPDVSSATLRHEMAVLEELGYLESMHTSSGRVPTELGYTQYVEGAVLEGVLPKESKQSLAEFLPTLSSDREVRKNLAKWLSKQLELCVVWVHDKQDHFYTGVSMLLSKPDFADPRLLYNISAIIDEFDERLSQVYPLLSPNVGILIGSKNPISKFCTAMTLSLPNAGALILLSPMRTDYVKSYTFLQEIKKLWK